MPRPLAWGFFFVLVLLSVAIPAAAESVPDSPTLSTTDRLNDRRFVTTGTRVYEVGTEAGRYPAMGFHTRGRWEVSGAPRSNSSTASGSR